VCTKSRCAYLFFKNIFWKQIRMSIIDTRLQYLQNINTEYLHDKTVWSVAHDSWVFKMSRMYHFNWKYTTLIPHDEINVTRYNLGCTGFNTESRRYYCTLIWMSVPFVEFHGISFSYYLVTKYHTSYVNFCTPWQRHPDQIHLYSELLCVSSVTGCLRFAKKNLVGYCPW
jgi:hypothetical protein